MTCPCSASSGPAPRRPRWRPATGASASSRRRRPSAVHAYFDAIKDENPAVEVHEHATPALVPLVEAGELRGPIAEATVRDALAPLLGERDADGESIFPRPPGAEIDTLLLGCTHYPLLRPLIEAVAGPGIAIVDSAASTASALAELLGINGIEAPGRRRAGRDAPAADDRRPGRRFGELAGRLFGSDFPDVTAIDLAVAAR